MKYLLLFIVIFAAGCGKTSKEPIRIVVDMSSGFALMEGDSIWWQQPKFIEDSSDGIMHYGHSEPIDTIFGLKNFNPLVVIVDGDTTRYFYSDTIRYTKCKQ